MTELSSEPEIVTDRFRRGSRASQILALFVACLPFLLIVLAFIFWAGYDFARTGTLIHQERTRIRELEARTSQALLFEPLGDAWLNYARTDISGLLQVGPDQTPETLIEEQVAALFRTHQGDLAGVSASLTTENEGLLEYSTQIEGSLPEAALPDILRVLESETPFYFVRSFEAHKAESPDGTHRVHIRLTCSIYQMPGGAS
ncbi:MAG: hypothetical protein MRY63_01535 [Neomegalonema sp.]|nr:hypothetical protein [Neomegalonema sp.]